MAVTSDEINLLVYRYLQESGFVHSAFSFGHESLVTRSTISGADVPPGALITLIQKGLQYVEIESAVAAQTTGTQATVASLLQSRGYPVNKPRVVEAEEVLSLASHTKEVFACSWNAANGSLATGSGDGSARLWDIPVSLPSGASPDEPAVLRGSTLLDHTSAAATAASVQAPEDSGHDVTCVSWSHDGSMLATAGQDGVVRLWTADGELLRLLAGHTGSVFSLEWAPSDTLLLTGAEDNAAIVWDTASGAELGRTTDHGAPVLDVAWQSDDAFATAGTDFKVHLVKVTAAGGATDGRVSVVAKLEGHTNEINTLQWAADGQLLASASDDGTVKVWDAQSAMAAEDGPDTAAGGPSPMHDLTAHTGEVYSLSWAPGVAAESLGTSRRLASGSLDHTVRLWDADSGACLATLAGHSGVVYSVSFSPDGLLLASGGFDKTVQVWDVKQGTTVRSYTASGGVYVVQWRADGMRLAAALSDHTTAVFDVRE